MELVYRPKKPETIKRFMHENNIPLKLVVVQEGKQLIYVNNDLKSKDDTIKKGDTLKIVIPDEKWDSSIAPEDIPLDIQYEDDYFLIVNKPADMQVMISKAHPSGTLANALNFYFQKNQIQSQIHFINRLDKETSGLMLIAKNRFIRFLFSDKTSNVVNREYIAILEGILDNKRLCIDLPVSRIDGSIKREVTLTGEDCSTSYEVMKEFKKFSLVKILSETGKIHQIRVHFSHFHYPIVGDELYNKNHYPVSQLLLLSNRISFNHPLKDQPVEVTLPMPKAFQDFIDKIK
ncbi:MAG: RluA family pseudouridine synthase [Candidatus Izemoplasmatales bacterium]|jgi:23S rRNA pseudouridine1911/1915/1917 synthase|nr:RluA family pseudouridine synthase [Candidatus Izemoplasmatales bacterium]MDY0372998.1 RluA family pseudouridine synthase [Candidatus Izemoplasmatales bacterium]NLF49460.1 RluA family pseudouridine synthase [Acholeplasmataceae bacterium]